MDNIYYLLLSSICEFMGFEKVDNPKFSEYLKSLQKNVIELRQSYKNSLVSVDYTSADVQNAYLLAYYPHYINMALDIFKNNAQSINNIIDNFTTNFMDITYNEVISFLETIRPGGERLVDQLMISEELTGKDLRTIAREYISNLSSSEVLYNTRKSSLFDLLLPELKKSVKDIENNIDSLVLDTDITKYEENSLKSSF